MGGLAPAATQRQCSEVKAAVRGKQPPEMCPDMKHPGTSVAQLSKRGLSAPVGTTEEGVAAHARGGRRTYFPVARSLRVWLCPLFQGPGSCHVSGRAASLIKPWEGFVSISPALAKLEQPSLGPVSSLCGQHAHGGDVRPSAPLTPRAGAAALCFRLARAGCVGCKRACHVCMPVSIGKTSLTPHVVAAFPPGTTFALQSLESAAARGAQHAQPWRWG